MMMRIRIRQAQSNMTQQVFRSRRQQRIRPDPRRGGMTLLVRQ